MRLKRVRIFGFKTFADRTEVNLDGGIIAVVGPNGCGKSNLVDAILWALGESNARHLRAVANQDVIFSGSARRKPVGFAEVSLLFDNEDGSLPIDTPEVSVTRRLSRNGDSDYFINQGSCRQRDVHELLADSGLGRAGYAIVSQKEIDQALAASPEDRRAWVDEAAGVQRYRARKVESIKRLASARDHLVRVDDILRELDTQREPLREEAETASKYKAASGALREIETGLLIRELAKASREITELEKRLAESAGLVRKESARAENLEVEAEVIRQKVTDIEHQMEGTRSLLQEAISSIERGESSALLGQERLRALDELESTLKGNESDQAVAQIEAELESSRKDESEEESRLAFARQELAGVDQEAKLFSAELKEAEQELAAARQSHSRRLKQLAEQEHRRERKALGQRELQGLMADLPGLTRSRDEAASVVEDAAQTTTALDASLKEAESGLVILRTSEDALGVRSRGLLAERAALEGRKRGIEATIQSHEGLAQGARAVVEAASRGELKELYIPVGEAIQVPREYALAIETALGASVNDLIVKNDQGAKEAINLLKSRRLGRATFQPISLMHPPDTSYELRALLNDLDVIGRACDLIQCESSHRPVIDSLLGTIVVVENLDAALKLAKSGGWTKMVTLQGEVVYSSGAVSGGIAGKHQYGLVQRRADLTQIDKDLDRIGSELGAIEREMAGFEASRLVLQDQALLAKTKLENAGLDLTEARDYLRTLESELQAAERSREKLEKELKALDEETLLEEEVDLDGLQSTRDSLMNRLAARSADASQVKERLRDAENRLGQATTRALAIARRLDAARRTEAQRLVKLQSLEPERQKIRQEIDRSKLEEMESQKRRTVFESELRDAQTAKDALIQEGIRATEESKGARANVAAIAESNHQSELASARAEARRANAAERLLDEYGIGAEEAIETADSVVVPPDAQPLANRLRKEIRAMGIVNVGAIEAYERLTTRFSELDNQRRDILEGIEQVEGSMHELDKLTRDQFFETFQKVEIAYREMFLKLFGGGEGKIFLDHPNSILDSGIEIEVTLPGKKRQRLDLLSGGERALCATGFLFALLQVKPSPLVILDEVDAPLDGRNVERFGDLLQEFTDRTQFIVITHNPTTIERAPVWLGITMQEPGVSSIVPVRLPVPESNHPRAAAM